MDEKQTLQVLSWSIGGIVGFMFVLDAFALTMR